MVPQKTVAVIQLTSSKINPARYKNWYDYLLLVKMHLIDYFKPIRGLLILTQLTLFTESIKRQRACAWTQINTLKVYCSGQRLISVVFFSTDMKMNLLLAVTLMSIPMALVQGAEKKKLQIGIKKRVDNCPIKSRKGDVLNMHYTVSVILLWPKCYSSPKMSYFNCLFWCAGETGGWDRIWQQYTEESALHLHSWHGTGHQGLGSGFVGVSNSTSAFPDLLRSFLSQY